MSRHSAKQRQRLQAMGLQTWSERGRVQPQDESVVHEPPSESASQNVRQESSVTTAPAVPPSQVQTLQTPPPQTSQPNPAPASDDVPAWLMEDIPPISEDLIPPQDDADYDLPPPEVLAETPAIPSVATLNWDDLQTRVSQCQACGLHKSRKQTVFGVGSQSADWMIIGEAPGADEDKQGEPFVGRAGKLLDEMLWAAGHPRDTVFIANILKCRPPGNRDPQPAESIACRDYLMRQIALVQPKIILAVGRVAATNLLQSELPLRDLRGRAHVLPGTQIPVYVTYHPSYLLRTAQAKAKTWADLRLAMAHRG